MLIEKSTTLFSIIIPTYQREHLIWKTLDSILAQTFTNWECIIIDDGSTDNTEEIVAKYVLKDSRFQYFIRPEEFLKGPNSCRNYGFQKSKGDYIKWFDSDDIMVANCLESAVNIFIEEDCDLVVSNIEFIDLEGNKLEKKNNYFSQNLIEDYFTGKISYYVFQNWRRKFINKQTQLFDEQITNLDDWDFNLRMLYQNPKIEYIHKALIQYRIHSDSLAHEIMKLNYEEICSELAAREKHLKLLKINKKADHLLLNHFIKERCKWFFIKAIQVKDINRYKYLRMLIKKQLELLDYGGIIKLFIAYTIYSVFNKGYMFLKKI